MKVLVACEYSGVVRDAFIAKGHDAISCDLLESEQGGPHYVGPVEDLLWDGWDLIIAHPPCTYLSVTGNRHYANRPDLYLPAVEFARMFMDCADQVAIENPVGRLSTLWRKPDQYIQPWQFGHPTTKKTGLWIKGLPLLQPTNVVEKEEMITLSSGKTMSKWYYETSCLPTKERAKVRSRTFSGIAQAMADQWG